MMKHLLKFFNKKRGADPYSDFWALPGDLVHPMENNEEAVKKSFKRFNWFK